MVVDKNGNEIKVGDVVRRVVPSVWPQYHGDLGKEYTVTATEGQSIDAKEFSGYSTANYFEIVKQEPKTMKYEVGKKYVIGMDWAGLSKGDVITVTKIKPKGQWHDIFFSCEKVTNYGSFGTMSLVCDSMTPYTEPKSIVTEKVTRVIEAGEYGHVWVDDFDVGVDKHITIEVNSNVFTKQSLGKLIETLKQIHEVM